MKDKYLTNAVLTRLALSLLLLAGVFSETGIWTTLAMFLMMVNSEMMTYIAWRKSAGQRALNATLARFDGI